MMTFTIDAAIGGAYDRIGHYLTQAGLEDASGSRRYYMELLSKGQFDKVSDDLKVDVETLLKIFFEQAITAALEEQRAAFADRQEVYARNRDAIVRAAVEEEREACAKVAERHGHYFTTSDGLMAADSVGIVALNIARDIRARATTSPSDTAPPASAT